MEEPSIQQLKYLDIILFKLQLYHHSTGTFQDLFNDLCMNKISFDSKIENEISDTSSDSVNLNFFDIEGYKKQVFIEAIYYLRKLELVSFSDPKSPNELDDVKIRLSYKGRIKLTNSFVDEYRKEQVDKSMRDAHIKNTKDVAIIQKITLPAAVIISLAALTTSYLKQSSTVNHIYCYPQDKQDKVPNMDNSRSFHSKHESKDSTDSSKNFLHK